MTVAQWLDEWTENHFFDVKPRTVKSYTDNCRLHLKPYIGAIKLAALDESRLSKLFVELYKGTEEKKPLSAKTLKNIHGTLHRALADAVRMKAIKFNPADNMKLPRIEKKEMHPLDEKQVQAFLKAIKGHEYETVYFVTLFTGVRQGEVLGLTWDCVDFTNGTILIDKQLQRARDGTGLYYFIDPKNNKARLLTPAAPVMAALKERRRVQSEDRLRAGEFWERFKGKDLVFTSDDGHHLSEAAVYGRFKKVVEQIGAPETRFHDLRHSYAVAALQAGDDIKTVQESLGHHTAAFTLDVYGHVTTQMKQQSAKRMERFILSVQNL